MWEMKKKNLLNILPLRMMQLYDFSFQAEFMIREMFSAERKLRPQIFPVILCSFIVIYYYFQKLLDASHL